jgi:hypothetical protein
MLCCFGACYYKKKYLEKKPETKDAETQTVVEPDTVHIRTVEEPSQVNNIFTRSSAQP